MKGRWPRAATNVSRAAGNSREVSGITTTTAHVRPLDQLSGSARWWRITWELACSTEIAGAAGTGAPGKLDPASNAPQPSAPAMRAARILAIECTGIGFRTALTREHALRHKQKIRRPFRQSPHVPREPVGAVADEHPDLATGLDEPYLLAALDAVQHRVLVVAGCHAELERQALEAADQQRVVRAERGPRPFRARLRAPEPLGHPDEVLVHVALVRERQFRGFGVRALDDAHRGPERQQRLEVGAGAAQVQIGRAACRE